MQSTLWCYFFPGDEKGTEIHVAKKKLKQVQKERAKKALTSGQRLALDLSMGDNMNNKVQCNVQEVENTPESEIRATERGISATPLFRVPSCLVYPLANLR